MELSIIVAMGKHREIGKDNSLLWHLSEDLKRFKAITTGHTILMGRKTFESLPNGPLPNRRNIVISRQTGYQPEGTEVLASPLLALQALQREGECQIFVIGGGTIYQELLPWADTLYLTTVDQAFPEADTYFPDYSPEDWDIVQKEIGTVDAKNPLQATYYILKRNKKNAKA